MLTAFYIFLGGGLGSLARYGVSKLMHSGAPFNFPWGTFVSNMLACIILAIVVLVLSHRSLENDWLRPFVIIGFCGGFSTFSTFSNETVQLMMQGNWGIALLNILLSVLTGVGLIYFIAIRSAQ